MRVLDLQYLAIDRDRHGNLRTYVRIGRKKIRIREKRGTEAFLEKYKEAVRLLTHPGEPERDVIKPARAGTVGWLAAKYFGSVEFQSLDPVSQRTRRAIIDECLREPLKPGSADLIRDCPLSAFSTAHVKMLRDRKAKTPGAANNRRKWISSMFGWAVEEGEAKSNPARDVRKIKYATDGFYTWTIEDVRQYEAHYPVGSKPRLALALMLFLGVRRGDVIRLSRKMIRTKQVKDNIERWIKFSVRKTRRINASETEKPILDVLWNIIQASPCGTETFLETDYGKPYTAAGFGNAMRDWCDQAGLSKCTAHGLRKAGATIAADSGATDRQLMALFDWTSEKMANTYTARVNRKRLADVAARLVGDRIANID